MSLVQSRIGAQAIQVTVTFNVVYPNPFATLDHDIQGAIIVSAVSVLQGNILLSSHAGI
jgi:hypothetical protein